MTESTKPNCSTCRGSGKITETRTVQDPAMGAALGVALGIGYFPSTRRETTTRTCYACGGTGKRR